jgi:hypothetical protein
MLIDTQILSFAYKKKSPKNGIEPPSLLPNYHVIPSIVCQEFLESQIPDTTSARYYFPLLSQYSIGDYLLPFFLKSNKAFSKARTDQFILDFNNEYPSQMEFGHIAISNIINDKRISLFHASISQLGKKRRKRLKNRFKFIVMKNFKCEPLSREAIEIGLELLSEFLKDHEPKDNFRNTVNDIMILAMAECNGISLWTEDALLSQFAENVLQSKIDETNGLYTINMRTRTKKTSIHDRESKEYINRSWRCHEIKSMGTK